MNKKKQKDNDSKTKNILLTAWQYLTVGDYYKARQIAKKVLAFKQLNDDERHKAREIITEAGIDYLAISAGGVTLFFVLVSAYIAIY